MKNTSQRIPRYATLKTSSQNQNANSNNFTATKTTTPDRKRSVQRSPFSKTPNEGKPSINIVSTKATVYLNTAETSLNNTSTNNNLMVTKGIKTQDNMKKTALRNTSQFAKIDLQSSNENRTRKNYSIQKNLTTNRTSSTCNVIYIDKNLKDSKKLIEPKHISPSHSNTSMDNSQSNSFMPKNSRYNSDSYSPGFLHTIVVNSERRKDEEVSNNEIEDKNSKMNSYANKFEDQDISRERRIGKPEITRKRKEMDKEVGNSAKQTESAGGSNDFMTNEAAKFIQIFDKIKTVLNLSVKPELENLISIVHEKDRNSNFEISDENENKIKLTRALSANALSFEIETLEKEINEMNQSYVNESRSYESPVSKFNLHPASIKSSSATISPLRFASDIDSTKLYSDIIKVSSDRRISIYKKFLEICIDTVKEITEKLKKYSDKTAPSTINLINNINTEIINANIINNMATPVNQNSSVNVNVNVNLNTIITENKEKEQKTLTRKVSSMQKQLKSKKLMSKARFCFDEDDDFGIGPIHEGVYANIPISNNIHVNKPKEANMHFRVFTDGDAKSCDENEANNGWILGIIDSFEDSQIEKEKENEEKESRNLNRFQRMRSKSLRQIKMRKNFRKEAKPYLKLFVDDELISDDEEENEDAGEKNESRYDDDICIATTDNMKNNRQSPAVLQFHAIPANSSRDSNSSRSDQRSLQSSETKRTLQVRFEKIPQNVLFTTGKYEEGGERSFPESPKAIAIKKPLNGPETTKEQHCMLY